MPADKLGRLAPKNGNIRLDDRPNQNVIYGLSVSRMSPVISLDAITNGAYRSKQRLIQLEKRDTPTICWYEFQVNVTVNIHCQIEGAVGF